MTSVLILLSGFDPGTYFIEDDGIAGNGIAQLRGPDGSIIFFNIPTEFLTVTASAGRSIIFNLTESFGAADINVGNLTNSAENPDFIQVRAIAGAGDVLLVSNGVINEIGADLAPDIVANTLIMSAATGVGLAFNPIETQVGTIEAETETGGIAITNYGNVTIGGLTDDVNGLDVNTSGDITFTNFGTILATDASPGGFESIHGGNTSGNVSLIANGFDSDITSGVDQDFIAAPGGNVLLQAGRDVSLGTGGANFDNDVRARGSLTVLAGRDVNVDGFADLASDGFGAATGGNLVVTAGRDINVLNSTGTDGSIGSEGSGGADTILTTGPNGFLRLLATSSATLFSSTGFVTVNADRAIISATAGITAGSGTVTIAPVTAGWGVNLGSVTDGAFALELSDAELDRIFTPSLTVGSFNAGVMTVSAAISPASATALTLRTGTDLFFNASATTLGALTASARDNVFQIGASVINAGGLFTVNVDNSDSDAGVGGTATLNGTVTATSATINGNGDGDTLNGSGFGETLFGNGGNDTLRGFGGADTLNGGLGTDTMIGGLGNDLYIVDNSGDVVVEAIGEGSDTVVTAVTFSLGSGTEVETFITANPALTTAINMTGSDTNNNIQGNAGNNVLNGLGGADTILGFAGQDTLDGGTGIDSLNGGPGNDTYFVDTPDDLAIEAVGEGGDIVFSTSSYILREMFEVEALFAAVPAAVTNINLTGNSLSNNIQGNAGNNILTGLGGADTLGGLAGNDTLDGGGSTDQMSGGPGDDNYIVDLASDATIEAPGEGNDSVFTSVTYVLSAVQSVERLFTTDSSAVTAIDLTGNNLDNNIQGNNGVNFMNGLGGSDLLKGFGGADKFIFTNALGPTNVDTIIDFQVTIDDIILENAVFTGLPNGALAASAFRSGAAAADADDRIIYNPATGAVLFDVDGVGGAAAVQFATLSTGLAVTEGDFFVV